MLESSPSKKLEAIMAGGFGLAVNDRNEILLIQRGYGQHKGKWSLPGGNQDKGETLKRTAIRETKEETGISMSGDVLYYIRPRRTEVWRGRRLGGHLKIQKRECLDAKWFQKDMLPHHTNLAFGFDKRCLDKWAAENPGSRRVHYPRSQMTRAGFMLAVNDKNEILLTRRKGGRRDGKWSLPGDKPKHGQGRMDAAVFGAHKATGVEVSIESMYYENRHLARIYLGRPESAGMLNSNARWFPLGELPDDESLAYAVDVRTIEKWAYDNRAARK